MPNVLHFRADRSRPQHAPEPHCGGARILFFTGVRYCRDDDAPPPARAEPPALLIRVSERPVDAATH